MTTSWPAFEEDPSGHFVRTEARILERAGHEVLVFAPKAGGGFGWPGVVSRIRARPWRVVEVAAWIRQTRARLRVEGFDRIIAHWALPSAWPIAMDAGPPLEVVSHGGDVRALVRMPARLRHAIVKRICARARTWRFVSGALLAELVQLLEADGAAALRRIACVEACALELPDVKLAAVVRRKEHGGARVAVCVGRLVRDKCVDLVIDHVAHSEPATQLIIVGDGPERGRLERHARACGIRVRFVGQTGRSEALTWIASADVVLHASRAEGLSTVIREAEALGVPVLRI